MEGSSDSRKKLFVSYGAAYAVTPKFSNEYYGWTLGGKVSFSITNFL
jgi:hypothetical protein